MRNGGMCGTGGRFRGTRGEQGGSREGGGGIFVTTVAERGRELTRATCPGNGGTAGMGEATREWEWECLWRFTNDDLREIDGDDRRGEVEPRDGVVGGGIDSGDGLFREGLVDVALAC